MDKDTHHENGDIPTYSIEDLQILSEDSITNQHEAVGKIRYSSDHRKQRQQKSASTVLGSEHHEKKCLHDAVEKGDMELCSQLLKTTDDVNYQDDKGRTLLHIAAAKGHLSIVALLLSHDADPKKQDILGNTPLHLAACTGKIPVVTQLLQAGSDTSIQDTRGNTPLHIARGRLRMLLDTDGQLLKQECIEVIVMMQTYLHCHNQKDEDLDNLSNRFEGTPQDVEELQSLLDKMSCLEIKPSC